MVTTTQTFEELALANPDRKLEMHRGRIREKPPVSFDHADSASQLGFQLHVQLDRSRYRVHIDGARLRRPGGNYFIPDVAVIPLELAQPLRGRPDRLAVYDAPLPLVVEVWSRSTGDYDVNDIIPEYMARGDAEIWRFQPYVRTLTVWTLQADGTYAQVEYLGGTIRCAALPGVEIDLDALFE
jgi:Uma2 family endonuclease